MRMIDDNDDDTW